MTDKDNSRFNEDGDDNASKERLSRRSFLVATAALGAATEMDAGSAALARSGSATGHANALIRRGTGAL
jgi:nitrous oxide reductase